ncbi:MAG: Lactoylglutathione lyase [Alyxoria varia]|nr:MAG: Lactoylglutathione lyase [Alyxoria varia]
MASTTTNNTDTSTYKLNHTMLRVKDPHRTIKFYEYLGLSLINKIEMPSANFTLYFLAYDQPTSPSHGRHWTDREGVIELTHNHGTENDESFTVNNGNRDPHKGFGHVCVSVDNIQAACKRLEDAGYGFQKRLTDGRMKSIAFALDPDEYWVEIVGQKKVENTEGVETTDPTQYRMNHSMIRVRDLQKSLDFYQNTMGMHHVRTVDNPSAKFTLYFLSYTPLPVGVESEEQIQNDNRYREGLLELTYNYGTESDPDFQGYHNGNDEPQGFGHIAVTVDDISAACARFDEKGVSWKKKLGEGGMKWIAFLFDPDGYWIEVVPNDALKKGGEGDGG